MVCALSGKMGGLKVDTKFLKNVKNAQSKGIAVGAYRYGYAMTEKEAQQEAKLLVDTLKENGLRLTYPIAYDVEDAPTQGKLTKEQLTKVIKAFQVVVEMNGHKFMIYS